MALKKCQFEKRQFILKNVHFLLKENLKNLITIGFGYEQSQLMRLFTSHTTFFNRLFYDGHLDAITLVILHIFMLSWHSLSRSRLLIFSSSFSIFQTLPRSLSLSKARDDFPFYSSCFSYVPSLEIKRRTAVYPVKSLSISLGDEFLSFQ